MRSRKPLAYILLLTLFFLLNCKDNSIVYDRVVSLPGEGWEYTDKIGFEYVISDTLSAYDIQLHIRNTKSFAYSNLWLFVETVAPAGSMQIDTLEVILADENGRWLGRSEQSINTMLINYKENIHFPERGIYKTILQHAMRDTLLRNITDIGLRVKYHTN